jgi:hypothetical protein
MRKALALISKRAVGFDQGAIRRSDSFKEERNMPHWCDYRDFAESLKWLADQDNQKIEEFLCSLTRTGVRHPVPSVAETPMDTGVDAEH